MDTYNVSVRFKTRSNKSNGQSFQQVVSVYTYNSDFVLVAIISLAIQAGFALFISTFAGGSRCTVYEIERLRGFGTPFAIYSD